MNAFLADASGFDTEAVESAVQNIATSRSEDGVTDIKKIENQVVS